LSPFWPDPESFLSANGVELIKYFSGTDEVVVNPTVAVARQAARSACHYASLVPGAHCDERIAGFVSEFNNVGDVCTEKFQVSLIRSVWRLFGCAISAAGQGSRRNKAKDAWEQVHDRSLIKNSKITILRPPRSSF